MLDFIPGQSAISANNSIKNALNTMDQAKQCAVLWFEEILNRKLYLDLGYSSINQYAMSELGFSKSRVGDFMNLCQTFKRLPKLRTKVETGDLKYTTARVLAGVMNESNQDEWLRVSRNKSRREVEQAVKRARKAASEKAAGMVNLLPLSNRTSSPKYNTNGPSPTTTATTQPLPEAVVPVRINLEMTPTQFARYEKLWELLRKRKDISTDKVEALLEIMDSFVCGDDNQIRTGRQGAAKKSTRVDLQSPSLPPVQIHVHQCPDCARSTVQTGKGELALSRPEMEKALCDCQISSPGIRNKSSIAPSVRRKVLAAARHKCQRPGCQHNRFLEIHHIVPRSLGGSNQPENLVVLCGTCHRLIHEKKMAGVGFLTRERNVCYTWKFNGAHGTLGSGSGKEIIIRSPLEPKKKPRFSRH